MFTALCSPHLKSISRKGIAITRRRPPGQARILVDAETGFMQRSVIVATDLCRLGYFAPALRSQNAAIPPFKDRSRKRMTIASTAVQVYSVAIMASLLDRGMAMHNEFWMPCP